MLHWLLALPAILKIGCAFAAILAIHRAGLALGLSVIISALALTLWSGAGESGLTFQAASFVSAENLLLLLVILLLLFFTEALGATGKMERTISALKSRLKRPRLLLAGLPAIIGLLPMPGGALVSAPLVASLDNENTLDPVRKTAINYWFRHIWEYWWPLYPGVVLALKYSGLSIGFFFLIQIPLTIASVAGGYLFILRTMRGPLPASGGAGSSDTRAMAAALVPIGLLVTVSVAGSYALAGAGVMAKTTANLAAMLAGLSLGLALIFGTAKQGFAASCRMFAKRNTWLLMTVLVGVQAFAASLKCPLDAQGITLVSQMRDELMAMHVPFVLIIAIVPFIAGAVTGIAIGFVGASFPLVFALLGANPPLHEVVSATTFAYAFGYLGMMLSPIHICFVVTNEYFKTRVYSAYRFLWGPVSTVLVFATGLSALYYFLFR